MFRKQIFGGGISASPIQSDRFTIFEREFAPLIEHSEEIARCIPGGETWGAIHPPREKILEYYLSLQA
ncbi:MAG: hypothetical protein SFY68_05475, partial [Candidatus Sumerlaeia bacterium]|nr:hypothetical protein [Candidatus Sumerlaeia bacterium]